MGLFKPAWMSDNLDKALKAVEKENSQQRLYEIVEDAMDIEVRLLAAVKLNDQSLAQDTYVQAARSSNKSVCFVAIDYLTNQKELAHVVRTHTDEAVCMRAADRITDQNWLVQLALGPRYQVHYSDKNVRLHVVDRITDQTSLAHLARYSPHFSSSNEAYSIVDVPYHAMTRITDKDILADVAKNATDKRVRWMAVEKITNQDVLADVARNDAEIGVRVTAARKITDQTLAKTLLETLAQTPEQKKYADMAKNASVLRERLWAADELIDRALAQETYVYIVKSDAHYAGSSSLRKEAVEKITDQDVLADVAEYEKDDNVQRAAKERLRKLQADTIQDESH